MSTPNEGQGFSWTPGDAAGAARVLSELGPREQQALGRVIRAAAAVGPVINGVARGIRVIRNTMSRLSEFAQRLAGTARNLRAGARERATSVRQSSSERAGAMSQQTREAVDRARGGAVNAATWAANSVVGGAQAIGRVAAAAGRATADVGRQAGAAVADAGRQAGAAVADAGRQAGAAVADAGRQAGAAAANAGRQAVAAGQEAAGKAGRWFNAQVSRGAAKASAALAGLAARRMDPTLTSPDQKLEKRDILLAQKSAELFSSPESERPAKAAELAAFIQKEYGAAQVNGPDQNAQGQEAGVARNVAASQEMSRFITASPSASTMSKPDTQAGKQSESGAEPGTGRHRKQPGQGKDQSKGKDQGR
ncbi:hypothetical protein Kfla_5644 [Kribbella flavida DSM 17836]|uniref:Uncharacterized protein n=1 Tax=Kribbella flavida (strain DSM 17836 / JCM 10339 / NBRC 14399) TaxID=479435 RepID=D2PP54_KRIFD|nr:hypothetical protein [Kribbella flavida]ADB34650.1 hypothetical protein Kfla_5644 [Kribbella flavida DSM 17836]